MGAVCYGADYGEHLPGSGSLDCLGILFSMVLVGHLPLVVAVVEVVSVEVENVLHVLVLEELAVVDERLVLVLVLALETDDVELVVEVLELVPLHSSSSSIRSKNSCASFGISEEPECSRFRMHSLSCVRH